MNVENETTPAAPADDVEALCELVKQLRGKQKEAFEDGFGACGTSRVTRRRDPAKWHELVRSMGYWIGEKNPKTKKGDDPYKHDRSSEECIAYALGWYTGLHLNPAPASQPNE